MVPNLVGYPLPCNELKLVPVRLDEPLSAESGVLDEASDSDYPRSKSIENVRGQLPARGQRGREQPTPLEEECEGRCAEEWGELYLRGANSFEGYHGKDHLTRQAYDSDRRRVQPIT